MTWFLPLILGLSFLFRLPLLDRVPPELFGDELDVGYQAYSLLQTGRDMYGQPLPTYIHSLSEWRAPLLMYATVPTIATFGLNEWGVRLPQAIFGSLAPIILLLLVYQTTKSKFITILSSLSLSLLPWHILYSRSAFEVVIMLDLIMLGTLLHLRRNYAQSAVFYALSMYTYSAAVLFAPVWTVILIFLAKRRPTLFSIFIFIFAVSFLLFAIVGGPARSRFGLLSVFNHQDIVSQINTSRTNELSIAAKVMHNKLESSAKFIFDNYTRAFSPEFLFIKGDPTLRHSLGAIGQLLPITAPLLIIGLYFLVNKHQWIWIVWLLFAPIPASLTSDGGYHATRLFLMIPPLAVTIGTGTHYFIQTISKHKLRYLIFAFCILIFTFQLVWVAHYYLVHYPKQSWRWWHIGYKTAMTQIQNTQSNYSRIFINNTYEPALIRYLFYSHYSPIEFHKRFSIDQSQEIIQPNYDGFTLDNKVYFGTFSKTAVSLPSWDARLLPDSLYLISQRDDVGGDWDWRVSPPAGINILSTITNPSNEPIFYLVSKK